LLLSRFVPRYSGPRAGAAPAGAHRGEPYWRRADVADLHSVDRWRRMGMELVAGALEAPAKVVTKRGVAAAAAAGGGGKGGKRALPASIDDASEFYGGDDDGDDDEEGEDGEEGGGGTATGVFALPARPDAPAPASSSVDARLRQMEADRTTTRLYGPWQVRPAPPPPEAAAPGVVPGRSAYGSVDVPPLAASLPPGTAHVRGRGVLAAARALGVDAAPAVVGFVGGRGRRLPDVDGAVVLGQHAAAVAAAAAEAEAARELAVEARARADAETAWRRLLSAGLARVRLGAEHHGGGRGGGGGGGGGLGGVGVGGGGEKEEEEEEKAKKKDDNKSKQSKAPTDNDANNGKDGADDDSADRGGGGGRARVEVETI
jgi:xeroderma pigmentosum group C-complementing protein